MFDIDKEYYFWDTKNQLLDLKFLLDLLLFIIQINMLHKPITYDFLQTLIKVVVIILIKCVLYKNYQQRIKILDLS